MKALVTGASGFIGSRLVENLVDKGCDVRVLIHNRDFPGTVKVESMTGDIRDPATLKAAFRDRDILFHLAAALGGSLLDKKEFEDINRIGTENVLKEAMSSGIKKVIHFSSAGVLGAVKKNVITKENYQVNPINIYDQTKLQGETIALKFAAKGMNIMVVRPGWVYGPGDRRTFKLIKAIAKKHFILVTKGDIWQTPIFIDDLIQGTILCAEKGRSGEIYHLAGKEVLTVKQIVDHIADTAGVKIPSFTLPLMSVRAAAFLLEKVFYIFKKEAPLTRGKLAFFIHPKPLSIDKSRCELGFDPKTDFATGITKTFRWYREQGWI